MPVPDFESYKVAAAEVSSATKFNNLVQAIEDEFGDIDPDQIPGYPADATKFLRGDGAWASPAVWQAYTPSWTATGTAPSLGNGTLTGKYVQIGKLVVVRVALTIGSTSTMGTGGWRFSLPATAHADALTRDWGRSSLLDISVPQRFSGASYVDTTTTLAVPHLGVSGALVTESTEVGPTAPFTWATSDVLTVNLVYEAA